MLEGRRAEPDELLGKANCRLASKAEVTCSIGQPAHLFGGRFDDALLPIADVDAPKPGERIEQLMSVNVGQPHSLTALQQSDATRLMPPERRQGMNQMIPIHVDECPVRD